MLDYDLHCHSNISDGTLTPAELVHRAAERGVKVLALTDHDDMDGLDEARAAAAQHGMTFINGVEISVTWRTHTVHVVGLGIDPAYPPLVSGLRNVRSGRGERAKKMADALAKVGIGGVLQGAYRYAGNPNMIGRAHFARYLVEAGHCKDVKSVFNRYLAKGKPGYVPHQWAALADAVGWIRGSGGVAALAHPGRYMVGRNSMGKKTMHELLTEFVECGGLAIEVVSTVGAGDSFVGGMVAALAAGKPPEQAFRVAMAAASAAVMSPGTELCREEDVKRLLPDVEISEFALALS